MRKVSSMFAAAALSAIAGASAWSAPVETEPAVSGEVALANSPFCEFFVVKTHRGFARLEWTGGLFVFGEGDRVVGPLHAAGEAVVNFVGMGEMRVVVRPLTPSADEARTFFFTQCGDSLEERAAAGPPPPRRKVEAW